MYKSQEIDGLDLYVPDYEKTSQTFLQNHQFNESFNYKPAIFGLSLSIFSLIISAILFFILFAKFRETYFLSQGIIFSLIALLSLIPMILLSYNQTHMDSVIFEETNHTKNKEMFCFLFILLAAIYATVVSFSNFSFANLTQFKLEFEGPQISQNSNNNNPFIKLIRFLSIPCLTSSIFLLLSLSNIISNFQLKFTLNLMSLNFSLIGAFVMAFFGIFRFVLVKSMVEENNEDWQNRVFGIYVYVFLISILILFANCVQAAIKRKGVLVGFGLTLFLIALVGLVFTGMFFRKIKTQIELSENNSNGNFTIVFQKEIKEKYCETQILTGEKNCDRKMLKGFLEENFWMGFFAFGCFWFMFGAAVFDFSLAKEEQDPPTNFSLFSFIFIMIGVAVAFAVVFGKHFIG